MARINSNVPSIIAQSNLRRSNNELELRLERLSTGLRINRGKDDPAGLIVTERISTELAGIEQAIKNGDRASSVIATAEASLAEINDLLNSIKALIVESANTGANSPEEREANQLQIDSAIQSITRISNTATFGGLRLLDGSLDYVTSGISSSTISKAHIYSASFIGRESLGVEVDVIASAQTAGLFLSGDLGGPPLDGTLLSTTTLQISGPRGVQEITLTSNASLTSLVAAVNNVAGLTGVKAELINGNPASGMVFRSEGFGSNEFVSVQRVGGPPKEDDPFRLYKFQPGTPHPDTSGGFPWGSPLLTEANRDTGQDVQALVNGNLAAGRGLEVTMNSASMNLRLLLDQSFAVDPMLGATTFDIIGGGSMYQLGPQVSALQQANIGIQSMSASSLGGTLSDGTLQFLSSLAAGQKNSVDESFKRKDFSAASDILETAIDEVSILRGRLGAFERNVLDTNSRSLQAAFENLSASRSVLMDADFARETSELTRAQILQSAGTTVLGLANQQAQSVLQLLG